MGTLAACREFFRHETCRVAGVYWADGMVYLAGVARSAEAAEVLFLDRVLLEHGEDGEADETALAEKTALLLARRGWERELLVLALPRELVTLARMALPPTLSPEERRETAYWEMVARQPVLGTDFVVACARQAEGDDLLAALGRARQERLSAAFRAAGLRLAALSLAPEHPLRLAGRALLGAPLPLVLGERLGGMADFSDWDEQFSAALCGAAAELVEDGAHCEGLFFPCALRREPWDYRRLAMAAAAIFFVIFLLGTALDGYFLYAARQEARAARGELALSAGVREEAAARGREAALVVACSRQLAALQRESFGAAGVLASLGASQAAGVRLTGLALGGAGDCELTGEAVDFAALSSYLGELADGRLGAPVLRHSERAGTAVRFTIALPVPAEEEADHAAL